MVALVRHGSKLFTHIHVRVQFLYRLINLVDGAFLPLCPSPMSGPDPRASKSRYTIIDGTGSHQKPPAAQRDVDRASIL